MQFEKDVLRHFFGGSALAQDAKGDGVDAPLVAVQRVSESESEWLGCRAQRASSARIYAKRGGKLCNYCSGLRAQGSGLRVQGSGYCCEFTLEDTESTEKAGPSALLTGFASAGMTISFGG